MPTKNERESRLLGTWWRVREEDEPGCTVYRHDGAPLPPSRGRQGFTLHEHGRATLIGPGADDRLQGKDSRWHLDEKGQLFVEGSGDSAGAVAEIQGDRLLLRR